MRRLFSPPSQPASYLDQYIAIRDKKHQPVRGQLTAIHPLIARRYLNYEDALERRALNLMKCDPAAIAQADILRSCYNGTTKALKALKERIRAAQPERLLKYCPMCGTTLPGTYDHYLPAVDFPELSVHPMNLVPCCGTCNSKKDDYWISDRERLFLHAYTDEIPDQQFLYVELIEVMGLRSVGANFRLIRPDDLSDQVWSLIDKHFHRLELLKRYDERGNDEIAEIIADCRSYIQESGHDPRNFLQSRARDRALVYGRNHWIAVLMNAMAVHAGLPTWVARVPRQ